MSTETLDQTFLTQAQEALVGLSVADLHVLAADVARADNAVGQSAWRVRLFLDRPSGSAWPVESSRSLKRLARSRVDQLAQAHNLVQDGLTDVVLTLQSPEGQDLAVEDMRTGEERDGAGQAPPR